MKKSQLRKIIRESIRSIVKEQSSNYVYSGGGGNTNHPCPPEGRTISFKYITMMCDAASGHINQYSNSPGSNYNYDTPCYCPSTIWANGISSTNSSYANHPFNTSMGANISCGGAGNNVYSTGMRCVTVDGAPGTGVPQVGQIIDLSPLNHGTGLLGGIGIITGVNTTNQSGDHHNLQTAACPSSSPGCPNQPPPPPTSGCDPNGSFPGSFNLSSWTNTWTSLPNFSNTTNPNQPCNFVCQRRNQWTAQLAAGGMGPLQTNMVSCKLEEAEAQYLTHNCATSNANNCP